MLIGFIIFSFWAREVISSDWILAVVEFTWQKIVKILTTRRKKSCTYDFERLMP